MSSLENKLKFVRFAQSQQYVFKDLCEEFKIQPKTGYKWKKRFEEEGVAGLEERSRKPHRIANRTPDEIEQIIIRIRKKHPTWGPKKIHTILKRDHLISKPPAVSTIAKILTRHGMVERKRRRPQKFPSKRGDLTDSTRPNQVWCVDHKGWFKLKDGKKCYPLTITDLFSRFLIRIEASGAPSHDNAMYTFTRAFYNYGLPEIIRVDNGNPFATKGPGGLSQLAVWWMSLGISVEYTRPGHPQDNGSHERMHKTMKAECCTPGSKNMKAQQQRINRWQKEFNQIRPHETIEMSVPASLYHPSNNPMRRGDILSPYGPMEEVVWVNALGTAEFDKTELYIGKAFRQVEVAVDRFPDSPLIEFRYIDVKLGEYMPGRDQESILAPGYYEKKDQKGKTDKPARRPRTVRKK